MMKKGIATIVTIIILIGGYAYANDCDMVISSEDYKGLGQWDSDEILGNLLPKDAMKQAMINLKNFCCKENIINEEECMKDSNIDENNIFPNSAYLYDHILDVYLRRLDAKSSNENGEDLMYGLNANQKGKEWRDFITKRANNRNGAIPLNIKNKYNKYREADTNILSSWNDSHNLDDIKTKWYSSLNKYNEWKLVNKYMNACEISIYIYFNMPVEKDISRLLNGYQQCKLLVKDRVKKESEYTKAIIMQKGNKLLYFNIKSYLDSYFVQNNLIELQQIIFNIKNTFNEINKSVSELVKNCS